MGTSLSLLFCGAMAVAVGFVVVVVRVSVAFDAVAAAILLRTRACARVMTLLVYLGLSTGT